MSARDSRDTDRTVSSAPGAPAAIGWATAVAVGCYFVTGTFEAGLIRALRPTELELNWISDAMLSAALGVAVYLWLHLRATRVALTERERAQVAVQAQLSLAESLQRRLLPAIPETADGLEWAAILTSASRIGGDFFDFVQPDPRSRLMLIADVSGKGIAAAMALTLLRSTFRRLAQDAGDPAQLASRMSSALHDEWHGSPYVTGLIARIDLDTRTLTYTNAGHPRGIVLGVRQERSLAIGGPPLGLLREMPFAEESLTLQADDLCVFVTDGVSEALDDVAKPWATAITESLRLRSNESAASVCRAIVELAQDGPGPAGVEDWSDDRTVVVLKVGGAAAKD